MSCGKSVSIVQYGRRPAGQGRRAPFPASEPDALRIGTAIVLVILAGAAGEASATSFADFGVFGTNGVWLGQNVRVRGGLVGGNGAVSSFGGGLEAAAGVAGGGSFYEFGGSTLGPVTFNGDVTLNDGTSVRGNVDSGASISLYGPAYVDGDVTATQGIYLDPPVTITGVVNPYGGDPSPYVLVSPPGISVFPETSLGPLDLTSGMPLSTGVYRYDWVSAPNAVTFTLETSGGPIWIYVDGDVGIGDRVVATLSPGSLPDVYWETKGSWSMGDGSSWYGTIHAPLGGVYIGAGSTVFGAVYGDTVFLDNNSTVNVIPEPLTLVTGLLAVGAMGCYIRRRAQALAA